MAFILLLLVSAVFTKTTLAGVSVVCNEDSMSVSVESGDIPRYVFNQLSLADAACVGSQGAQGAVHFTVGYKSCSTELVVESGLLYFRNRIVNLPADPSLVISRQRPISIEFGCRFNTSKQEALPQHLRPLAEQIIGASSNSGNLKVNLQLTDSSGAVVGNGGLVDVDVGEVVNVQLSGNKLAANGLRVSASRCFVTLGSDPSSSPSYDLINKGGCVSDPTVNVAAGDGPAYRFSFEAFAFISAPTKPLFLHCNAVVCASSDANSACALGCSNNRRKKRNHRTMYPERPLMVRLNGLIFFKNH